MKRVVRRWRVRQGASPLRLRAVGVSAPPVAAESLSPGAVVGGRFRVEGKVASGGMGEIWVAEHCSLQMKVALKILLPTSLTVPEMVWRFKREAELLVSVQSDRVARLIDFLDDEPCGPVLAMEYLEGPSLAALLDERLFSVEEAIDLGIDVLGALRELHHCGIVHRDIKPANLLMRRLPGGADRTVIVDLGVSRFLGEPTMAADAAAVTREHTAVGTMGYMPPEQIVDSRKVTENADLYALASMLFRAVKGSLPFGDLHGLALANAKLLTPAPPLATGRADVAAQTLEKVLARALERSVSERYARADDMLAALNLAREGIEKASTDRVAPSVARGSSRRRPLRAIAGTILRAMRVPRPYFAWALAAALAGVMLIASAAIGARLAFPRGIPAGAVATSCTPSPTLASTTPHSGTESSVEARKSVATDATLVELTPNELTEVELSRDAMAPANETRAVSRRAVESKESRRRRELLQAIAEAVLRPTTTTVGAWGETAVR